MSGVSFLQKIPSGFYPQAKRLETRNGHLGMLRVGEQRPEGERQE